MKNAKRIMCVFIACLCMMLTIPVMADTTKGKLTLTVTDEDDKPVKGLSIYLYKVADETKVMDEFKGAGLSFAQIMTETDNAKNSLKLYDYMVDKDIYGVERVTDKNGVAVYTELEKGVYLITCGLGQKSTFDPFLCYVPTRIGNDYIYDIKSFPKVGDNGTGGGPSGPDEPDFPDEPSIPVGPAKPVEPVDPDVPLIPIKPDVPVVPDTPDVPETPEYSDKPIIPQTGALKWPMWVLASVGAVFIIIGIADISRKERDELE